MAQLARHACATRGLSPQIVHTNGDGQVWYADRRRLAQVLGNLLDNAGQHGGGATAVRLGRAPGVVFLEVDDEGPGVPAQDREAIFDRFVRGRPATARGDGDGTGLGLALVAQHVTAHGGSVRVTDRPGGGARFRVELPQDAQ